MPPRSPDDDLSIAPVIARTIDTNPRPSTPAYIAALRSIDTPVPDLASTLTLHNQEDDVNEANISFLRTDVASTARRAHPDRERERLRGIWERTRRHMELGEISDERLRRVLDNGGFTTHATATSSTPEAEGTRESSGRIDFGTPRTLAESANRGLSNSGTDSGTRSESRSNRVSGDSRRPPLANSATVTQDLEADRVRRERLQRVLARLNRIHDPAYGDRTPMHNSLYDWSPAAGSDDDLELRDYILELRQQQPNTHPEVLRVLAQTRLDAERERRERAADLASYGANAGTSRSVNSRARGNSASLRVGTSTQPTSRATRLSTIDLGQRTDRAERTSSGEDNNTPHLNHRRSPRNTYDTYNSSNNASSIFRQRSVRATGNGTDYRNLTRYRQPSPGNTLFQQAISYLARLRQVDSLADALLYAAETGFAINAFLKNDSSGGREEDFILDVANISPPPKTSLLTPGTVLRGAQKTQQWEYQYHPLRENASSREILTAASAAWQNAESGNDHSDDAEDTSRTVRTVGQISASNLNSFPPPAYLYPNRDQPLRAREGTEGGQNIQDLLAALQPSDSRNSGSDRRRTIDNSHRRVNEWSVEVLIHSVDYEAMTLTAEMTAHGIPSPGATSSQTEEDVLPSFENSGQEFFADSLFHSNTSNIESGARSIQSTAKPPPKRSITTYVEGELLDFRNTTFLTESFSTIPGADAEFWRKFEPFQDLSDEMLASSCVSRKWLEKLQNDYLLMRWKERCFVRNLASLSAVNGEANSDDDIENSGITISGFYYICMRRSDGHVEGFYHGDSLNPPHLHLVLDRVAGSGGSAWSFK